jgi:hypothetical protein
VGSSAAGEHCSAVEALALKSTAVILQRQLIELHRIDGRGFVDANNFKIRLLITLVEALNVSSGWVRGNQSILQSVGMCGCRQLKATRSPYPSTPCVPPSLPACLSLPPQPVLCSHPLQPAVFAACAGRPRFSP